MPLSQGLCGVSHKSDMWSFGQSFKAAITKSTPESESISEKCTKAKPSDRPSAAELLEDPFFAPLSQEEVARLGKIFDAAPELMKHEPTSGMCTLM